jgi:hypothetical protein
LGSSDGLLLFSSLVSAMTGRHDRASYGAMTG